MNFTDKDDAHHLDEVLQDEFPGATFSSLVNFSRARNEENIVGGSKIIMDNILVVLA